MALIVPVILAFQNCGKGGFDSITDLLTPETLSSTLSSVAPTVPAVVNSGDPLFTDKIFAPTSFWYQEIPKDVLLHANTAAMAADIVDQRAKNYNSVNINYYEYSSPYFIATADAPTVAVTQWDCQNKGYADKTLAAMWAAVPIPSYAEASKGTDMEMTVYQPSTNTIWEFWKMRKNISGGWEGCWGGRLQNASTSQGAFTSFYGTTATSLPFLGGQITREELQRGEIKHAIGMALVHAAPWSVVSYPAQRSDGDGKSIIPEGSRFRLDPNFDVDGSKMHPVAKIIAKAAQKYGFIVWDRAGSLSIRAANETTYTSQGIPTPYKDLFNGTANWAILNGFPWEKVQFLPMNYGKP